MVIKVNYMCYVNVTVIKRSNASIPNKKIVYFWLPYMHFLKIGYRKAVIHRNVLNTHVYRWWILCGKVLFSITVLNLNIKIKLNFKKEILFQKYKKILFNLKKKTQPISKCLKRKKIEKKIAECKWTANKWIGVSLS